MNTAVHVKQLNSQDKLKMLKKKTKEEQILSFSQWIDAGENS